MTQPAVQIRLCWLAAGGWHRRYRVEDDTPDVREAMRQQINEGAAMTPPVSRWIEVKDVRRRSNESSTQ